MENIITSSLDKSKSYTAYREFVTDALRTNPEVLELESAMLPYAELNEARLKRLDKTMQISATSRSFLQEELQRDFIWLVISESWCGDAAQSLPIMNKLAEASDRIQLQIVFRDHNLALMDLFLTNGGRSIPKLLVLDATTKEVLTTWGPRPAGAMTYLEAYKARHGAVDEAGREGLYKWYTHDKGQEIEAELIAMMKELK